MLSDFLLRKFALDESKSEFLHLGKSALKRIANRCVNGFTEYIWGNSKVLATGVDIAVKITMASSKTVLAYPKLYDLTFNIRQKEV